MLAYKLNVMHDEYDTINVSYMIKNRNAYPPEDNNCGGNSSTIIIDYRHLCDTIISDNTDLSIF